MLKRQGEEEDIIRGQEENKQQGFFKWINYIITLLQTGGQKHMHR